MLFNSVQFLLFFPVVITLYFVLPKALKNTWLLIASYFFYMCWNPVYGALLLFATVLTYFGGLMIEHVRKNRMFVQLVVIIVLFCTLAYFKYTNFLIYQVNAVLAFLNAQAHIARFDIVLPVGISFFTFQAAGYIIDVYRKDTKAEKNFITYALFVSFFPQLVAGPIERSSNLLRQLKQTYSFDARRVFEGLLIMLWGLLLKMTIADRCALIADTVFNNCHKFTGVQLIIGAIAFSIQIYCDFMGYSTVA